MIRLPVLGLLGAALGFVACSGTAWNSIPEIGGDAGGDAGGSGSGSGSASSSSEKC